MTPLDVMVYGFAVAVAIFFVIAGIAAGFTVITIIMDKFGGDINV